MSHPFLESVSQALASRGVATLRYQFPYMEAGGPSFGGRMTAYAASKGRLPGVLGLAHLGFPLHAPDCDSTDRWGPMTDVGLPMLFLQGDRDRLANLDLLRPLVRDLRPPGILHVIQGGDHSFKVLQRSGRSEEEVLTEIVDTLARWAQELVTGSGGLQSP